jgi:hypothetical protein
MDTCTEAPIRAGMHRIDITCAGYSAKGLLWRVEHDGKVIIERTRVPALDACRHLLATGIAGKLLVYRRGEHQFTFPDIERGAKFTVTEGPARGLTLDRYKAFPREDDEEDEVPAGMAFAVPAGADLLPSDDPVVGKVAKTLVANSRNYHGSARQPPPKQERR